MRFVVDEVASGRVNRVSHVAVILAIVQTHVPLHTTLTRKAKSRRLKTSESNALSKIERHCEEKYSYICHQGNNRYILRARNMTYTHFAGKV